MRGKDSVFNETIISFSINTSVEIKNSFIFAFLFEKTT